MKNLVFATLLTTALLGPATVLAQAAAPATMEKKPVAAKLELTMAEPKSEGRRGGARADVDARECLKLETNMAIHKCAEKYR